MPSSRLFNLVPLFPSENSTLFDLKELNVTDTKLLAELNNSTVAPAILKQLQSEDLGLLIRLREESMVHSFKSLNSLAISLLRTSFAQQNVEVKPILWNDSSPDLIQFLSKNDRVRPVTQLAELEGRLEGKHFRCYGVFHEKFPMPVSFVFVRLFSGIPDNLPDLLSTESDDDEQKQKNSCVFYSISSPVRGLNGIEFGSKLIKSVVEIIRKESPQIHIFVTFSPVPLLRYWLHRLQPELYPHLIKLKPNQIHDHKTDLLEACAIYLKKGNTTDPVARFHYRNGATLSRINFAADMTAASFSQSYGIQVNYIYHQ